ncbi:MAG TPA: peptidylprolyl isomerase [Candidatus Acidoferrum sp.]|nr:peptidylprolyl isomerase [Candidatus Acidoferrum sp.]
MMIPFRGPRLRWTAAALFLSAPAWAASAQDRSADALFPNPVVATGKGIEIKRNEVEDAFVTERTLVAQQQHVVIPESDRPRVESDILEHMVVDKILVQKATEEERAKTCDEAAKYFDDMRKSSPSEELFQQQVKASGKTFEEIKAAYVEKKLARLVLVRELVPGNAVSDEAVKKVYEDEKYSTNFAIPQMAHVAHILISELDPVTQQPLPPDQRREKEKLARELKARAEGGEDFAALAKQYSDDISTKDKGGEHTFARHAMRPGLEGFEAAAFSLKTNQISDLVETPFGYHIIKLLNMVPQSKVPFDQVSAGIKDYLANEEINKQLPVYIPKIEAEYNVKFLMPGYSPTPLAAPATNAPPTVSVTNAPPSLTPVVDKK